MALTKFTFGSLWKILRETYDKNERDIFWAYGQNTFAKVDRLYANSDAPVKAILLTNLSPITEEKLGQTFKQGTFVAVFTLKRDRSKNTATDSSVGWLNECRLYKGCGFSKGSGTVKTSSSQEHDRNNENKSLLVGLPLFNMHVDQFEIDDNVVEEDEFARHFNETEMNEEEVEEEEDANEANDLAPQSAPMGSGARTTLSENKKNFVKGLRRQHWAAVSYRNFFHNFLQSTRRVKKFEDLNLYLEDSKF